MPEPDLVDQLMKRHALTREEASEMYRLLVEMLPLALRTSKQLSAYIVQHQLGRRYQTIAGIVRMRQDGEEWNFEGGFSKAVYHIICVELGLVNQGTRAEAVGFTPFKELYLAGRR